MAVAEAPEAAGIAELTAIESMLAEVEEELRVGGFTDALLDGLNDLTTLVDSARGVVSEHEMRRLHGRMRHLLTAAEHLASELAQDQVSVMALRAKQHDGLTSRQSQSARLLVDA